jgi:hypothetical protein
MAPFTQRRTWALTENLAQFPTMLDELRQILEFRSTSDEQEKEEPGATGAAIRVPRFPEEIHMKRKNTRNRRATGAACPVRTCAQSPMRFRGPEADEQLRLSVWGMKTVNTMPDHQNHVSE